MPDTLSRLEATIRERRKADPETSYVAKLCAKGRAKIAQKETTKEAADLIFHLGVLLADMGLSFEDVFAELDAREGVGGLVEKAARKD
jgi:phosphoribosyl-ATP pyrophosphohydrolase